MSATVLNTDANINAKTVSVLENNETVTGTKTFNLSPNPPFVVQAGSANVPNLDADKLDGLDSTTFARWDGGGTPLGQIAFPAVQSSSSGANVLDDYEEGSWTPAIASSGGGAATYTNQTGRYVKVGKRIDYWGFIQLATKGTLGVGAVTITGLTYASAANGLQHPASFGNFSITTAVVWITGFVPASSTSITVNMLTAAATGPSSMTVADLSSTAILAFGGTYEALT